MKIDTASIDGFDAMTPEQKLEAIMGIEVPDPVDLSGYVKKDVFDAKAKEAAEKGRALQEKQTEEERAAAERDAEWKRITAENEQYKLNESIAQHKANFALLGYDSDLADATAKALASGDMNIVFANQKKFLEIKEKAIKADVLKATPAPSGGSAPENQKSDAVMLAESLAESRASATNLSRETMSKYTGGK